MKLVLEKGRKGLPDGTIRTYGGKKFKKIAGKWEYLAEKHGTTITERKTVTRNDQVEKELELIVGKLPSREYIEQEIMKKVRAEFPSGLPDHPKKILAGLGLNSFKDLASVAQGGYGQHENWASLGTTLSQAFGEYQFSMTVTAEESNAWSQLSQFYADMNRVTNLSDPRFTGQIALGGQYSRAGGLLVTYRMNMGPHFDSIPAVTIPYDKLEEWAEAWYPDTKQRRSFLTAIKKKDYYKKWTLEHDPEIKAAMSDFQKMTGFTVKAESHRSGRQVQLKATYIKKLTKVFGTLKAGLDMKKFVPRDGMTLGVRVTGAGKTYAGFYMENEKTINIAPSKPGTIGHEVGHYLWYRGGKALEDEFMDWATDSGLLDRIRKTTRFKMSEAEREQHINHTFNAGTKNAVAMLTDRTGKDPDNKYTLSETARNGLQTLTNIMRQRMVDDPKNTLGLFGMSPVKTMTTYTNGKVWGLVDNAQAKGMFPGEDPQSLKDQLIALTNNMNKLDEFSRTSLDDAMRSMIQDARAGTRDQAREYFQQKPGYWEEPTEIFARTFRNYIAMKAGREIYEKSTDERRAHPKQFADALGWGFPEVDPTQEMLDYDNGALQKLLKKHLGERTIKSMMTMMMELNKGRKADPEGMVKKMGKYWYKKVGKKWIYQGQGAKPGEFKFRRKVPSMVSKLAVGTEVEVKGKLGEITAVEGEWLTVRYADGSGTATVKSALITKVVGNDNPKAVDKSITEATPDNRASKVAEIIGADLKEEVVIDTGPYTFTPTDRELMRATDVPAMAKDYTAVLSSKVELVSAKDILTKPRPSFIPEISDDYFSHSLNRLEGVKIGENEYAIDVGRTIDKRDIKLAVVNGAVLAATQDYYMKRQKAAYMQRWEEGRAKLVATIPALEQKIADARVQGGDTYKFEHMLELAKEIEKMKKPKGVLGKRIAGKPPRMIGAKRATYSHMNLIREFHPETGRDRSKMWEIHRTYVEDLGQKLLDAAAQFEEDLGAYSKGEETSYGDKGTKDNLLASHGVKVKRQNGDEISDAEIKQLSDSLDQVYAVLGDRSNMSRNWGLKISHSGDVGMHARKAAGLFFPAFKAIGVSYAGDSALTLAHEFTHFMDYKIGGDNYFHYSSDDPTSSAGKIAQAIIKNTGPMPGYWGRSCECFARGVEAYAAYKMGNDPTTVHSEHMPSREVLVEQVFPLVEQFLSENAEALKSVYSRTKMTMGLSKSYYSRLADHLKERGKYVEGMDMDTDIVELHLGITEEMEHTDDVAVAEQIALDHLVEDPYYYSKLAGMEMGKAYGDDEDDDEDDEDDLDKEIEKERRNEENKDKNEKAKLLKAKGRKETDQYKLLIHQAGGLKKVTSLVAKTLIGVNNYDRDEAMDQALLLMTGTDEDQKGKLHPETVKAYEAIRYEKSMPTMMMKAKAYPMNTIRTWKSGKKMKKTPQGWVEVTGGKTDQERGAEETKKEGAQKEAQKKRDPKETAVAADNFKGYHARMKEKYGTDKLQSKMTGAEKTKYNKLQDDVSGKTLEKKKLDGSKEMLSALNSVANTKKPVFMDDLTGKKKAAFNELTKEGLITWRHMGSDEYRAELTEAGISAMDGAAALKQQGSREEKAQKESLVSAVQSWVEGAAVKDLRDTVRKIDSGSKRIPKEQKEYLEPLLDAVEDLSFKAVYRGTRNPKWLEVEPGDEVDLGLASFSKVKRTAEYFARKGGEKQKIMLQYIPPPMQGLDVAKISKGFKSWSARDLAEGEKEVILRSPKVVVKGVTKKGAITVIEIGSAGMSKSKREEKKAKKALLEELYRDFDTPIRGETKKEKKSSKKQEK